MFEEREHGQPHRHGEHDEPDKWHVHPEQPSPPVSRRSDENEPVVHKRHRDEHHGGLFRRERQHPETERRGQPHAAPAEHPAPRGGERHQNKRRAQHLGAAADVADRLRHHRVHGEQRRGEERTDDPPGASPHELEQQGHVQHVQQHVRDMKAGRRRAPEHAIDRVRNVHRRPRDLAQHDGLQIERRPNRSVFDDEAAVVVDERIVERVDVDETGEEDGHADGQAGPRHSRGTLSQSRGIV